jgi:hypothetical protein
MATSPTIALPLRTPVSDSNGLMTFPWSQLLQYILAAKASIPAFISGAHSVRLTSAATSYPAGSIFYESDRKVFYIALGGVWIYLSGVMSGSQPALPTDLGANDYGFLFYVTDFVHGLMWNGTGWVWAPGEAGSGFIVAFISAPAGFGWQACDGSVNVETLGPDGILTFATVPNTPGSYYRQ